MDKATPTCVANITDSVRISNFVYPAGHVRISSALHGDRFAMAYSEYVENAKQILSDFYVVVPLLNDCASVTFLAKRFERKLCR